MTGIAIDGFRAVLERNTSGAHFVTELSTSLAARAEVDHVLLLVPRSPADGSLPELSGNAKIEFLSADVPYDPTSGFRDHTRWIQRDIPRLLRRHADRIDHYVAPYHYTPIWRPRSMEVGTVIHDVCGLGHGYPKHKLGFYRHLAMLLTASICADRLIPISRFTSVEFSKRFRWATGRLTPPVYNGISDRTLDESQIVQELSALSLEAHRYFFGVAAAHPRKGTDLLLAAYARYRADGGQLPLVLLGGEANSHLILASLPFEVHDHLVLLPPIPSALRNALYAGAIALVFPSRCEGFGYPVLEAMRQGCPTVAASSGPAGEIVGGLLPLLDELHPDRIAAEMGRLEGCNDMLRSRLARSLVERSGRFGQDYGRCFMEALVE
jgi:glycosyltransferase involved in cell wall biosynthesis